ncbi:hypothetical protein J2Z21_003300 [Streptomyces griseochromogenes]|uniref:Lipoprotein n=1 Tax=Streptomyces griseochromogenes TaxID=68214 RepID=A0ABS4LSJ0_9ACTN|nr:hypothetical protein [Streptomyces griseochromogenes]
MRPAGRPLRAASALTLATLAALLTGCHGPADAPVGSARPTSDRPSGYGAQFLAIGECSSFGTTSFTEVPCASERAAARVVARYDGTAADGPLCPSATDFVLHISEQRAQGDEDGDGAIPQGYACMRNLEPPHPGAPGAGGGPRTIPGDCVYGSGDGQVRETACDGSGPRKPQYKVMKAAADRTECPASTTLYVQLGGRDPVGCARRL